MIENFIKIYLYQTKRLLYSFIHALFSLFIYTCSVCRIHTLYCSSESFQKAYLLCWCVPLLMYCTFDNAFFCFVAKQNGGNSIMRPKKITTTVLTIMRPKKTAKEESLLSEHLQCRPDYCIGRCEMVLASSFNTATCV